jgi:uncharacterized protein
MTSYPIDEENRVRRYPKRASYDRDVVHAILDEALICHVSFVQEGKPFIIPTIHARLGDEILLHGSRSSRLLKHVASGAEIAIAVTLLDAIVLARSTFNSSMNYRSAVIFGTGRPIEDDAERETALKAFSEQLIPGRWADSRPNTRQETAATEIVAVTIRSASAKIRAAGIGDDASEHDLPYWSGLIPLDLTAGAPIDDTDLKAGIRAPDYVTHYTRKRASA